jgi:hypothetical protein
MITGGVASVIYGDPRFTRDIEVVLELRGRHIEQLATEFAGGAFYVPPIEVLEEEAARQHGGHFNLIHRDTSLRAHVYLIGDDLSAARGSHCQGLLHPLPMQFHLCLPAGRAVGLRPERGLAWQEPSTALGPWTDLLD